MNGLSIVIENEDGILSVSLGVKAAEHQLEWSGAGVKCYLVGKYSEKEYHAACNLMNNTCIDAHIPLHSVRRVKQKRPARGLETETKRMF